MKLSLISHFGRAIRSVHPSVCALALMLVAAINTTHAASVTVKDSIVLLSTRGSTNYTFTEPVSGKSVVIMVTMAPNSSDPNDVLALLDGGTRLGLGNLTNGGDANWIDTGEGLDFTASLVSASAGVPTNSIQFKVAGMGIRLYAMIYWNSSAGSNSFNIGDGTEQVHAFDTDSASLSGTNYFGQLRLSGQMQMTDAGSLSGQSLVLEASFSTVSVSTGTQVGGATSVDVPSLSFIDSSKVVLAGNFGGTNLVRDGISFTGISSTGNPTTKPFGAYSLALSAPSGTLNSVTFGDDLFGSFIWADNQNEMSVGVSGLDSAKTYRIYYLNGDNRSLAFNMFLTVTGTNNTSTNSSVGTISWGSSSSNAQGYIYLPVTVSGASSVNATMTKNGSSAGVGMSGIVVVEGTNNVSNTAPTLTTINTLTNAVEDTAFSISYDTLKNASDATDAQGDAISFRIELVNSGTLKKNGTNVAAGSTLLSTNETLAWTPATNANGTLSAFSVKAWDGNLASTTAVAVNVNVAAVNDSPFVVNPIPVQSATYGTFFSYTVPNNSFSDVDNATLAYYFNPTEALPSPPGLSFDQASSTLSGTPTSAGQFGGQITAYDGSNGTSSFLEVDVAKATLIVTPNDVSRAYGQNNPTFTGTISGIKNGDNITATYTTTATAASVAGTYLITATLSDPNGRLVNYNVTTNQGTLTITNVPVVYIADARTNSWMTNSSGRYARIYKTKLDQTNGISSTTWSNGFNQALPVYAGVQEVYSSTNWAYVRASGLGSHVMGPWYFDANKTQLFAPWPVNQKTMFRIPRTPTVSSTKTLTATGAIGWFVDGVAMFDDQDSFFWNGTTETNQGTGYWYRDAYVNEGLSFDPNNAHQEQTGMHHYHANPPALRFLLNDNVGSSRVDLQACKLEYSIVSPK